MLVNRKIEIYMIPKNATILLFTVGTAIGATALTANLVQAATVSMDLSFFNPSGQQIGKGSFTYDDHSPIDIIEGKHHDLQIGIIKKWFYVKDFEATIKEMSWGLPSLGIWDALNNSPQSIVHNNYGEPTIINRWLMGDQEFLKTPALIIEQEGFKLLTSDPNQLLEGEWIAKPSSNAVPESPTVLGVLTAIGILTLFKRVVAQKKH